MKLLLTLMIYFCASFVFAQQSIQNEQSRRRTGTYEEQADSLRKKHLTPRRDDSVNHSGTDRMPVLRTDTTQSDRNMPVVKPVPDQHMPVKELSDTSKHK